MSPDRNGWKADISSVTMLNGWEVPPVLVVMVAALQLKVLTSPPLPRVPPPPPTFTRKVQVVAQRIEARVNHEFKRCGNARAYSNKYSVEAFGKPRFSAEWKIAADAMNNALTVCRDQRRTLRKQEDFLVGVAQNGSKYDGNLAAGQLVGVWYELQGIEEYFATEAPRYRQLLTEGWGDPHCLEQPDGYMPASSLCSQPMETSHP